VTLEADVDVSRGPFRLRARLAAPSGSVTALLGPNGAGKSTLLRALAGLAGTRGSIVIDGVDVTDAPPHLRRVGWVPQDGALFPHLSARDNVAFGIGGRAARAEADRWLSALDVADLADRRPAQLSGGQAQKVAIARALARRPRLLLLDEPLAALDATARGDVRRSLRRHLAGFDGVTLLVTHDPLDAMSLADRVIALDAGRVVQDASPREVARAPRTPWLAGLMGVNAFRGRLSGSRVALADGGELMVADGGGVGPADALLVVAPHAVTLHRNRPEGSARNAWPVTVAELTTAGSRVRVRCEGRPPVVAEVTGDAVGELGLVEGVAAWASVKATEVTVVLL
jgi:molybdate transport system permease protein